jgi:hypothetical protein
MREPQGHDTPEACALAGWTPEWQARVIEVDRPSPDVARVLVDTVPSHPMRVTCERRDGLWYEGLEISASLPGEIPPRVQRRLDRAMRRHLRGRRAR